MATAPLVHRAAAVEKIPTEKLTHLSYWERLDPKQQQKLSLTVGELSSELVVQWKSVLRAGKLVNDLYELANPHGAFLRTLKFLWGDYFSSGTAYRYRNVYLATRDQLPEQVIDVAIASGVNLVTADPNNPFGKYADLVKKLPPPKTGGVKAAQEWVETFKAKKQELDDNPVIMPPTQELKSVLRQHFLDFRNDYKKLTPKQKDKLVEDHIEHILWLHGVSRRSFAAAAPPEEWQNVRPGRPTTKE